MSAEIVGSHGKIDKIMSTEKKWYQNPAVIVLLLIFFFPAGLFLMWRYTTWNRNLKLGITAALTIFVLIGATGSSKEKVTPMEPKASASSNQPTEIPKPVDKFNIVVTSQIVKKVDGKYRYFFDIRNHDSKPFEGNVTISLFTDELKDPLAGDTFNTTKAIKPELGTSVYADANTGPTSVHGANGITKFKFTVKQGESVVNNGEGIISEQYEDLSI